MTHKKLKTLAALTSALVVANMATASFAVYAAGSHSFVTVAGDSYNPNMSIFGGEYMTLPQIEGDEEYGIRITKLPSKTDYLLGEELDISDIRIAGYCNIRNEDGKTITILDFLNKDLQAMIDNGTVEIDTSEFYNSRLSGVRSIYIRYGNAETKFDVYVENENEAGCLILNEPPFKCSYTLGEELDLTGAKVSGFYTDGENSYEFENADLQTLIDEGTVTIDSEDLYTLGQKSGDRDIHISYYNSTATFRVFVVDLNEGCYFSLTPPDKLTYKIGEKLDLTGATISGAVNYGGIHGDIFSSDASIYIENGLLKLDDAEFDNTKPGTYTINLILGHDLIHPDIQSFEVTVENEAVKENYIFISEPDKTVYNIGDALDFTGADLVITGDTVTDEVQFYSVTDLIEQGLVTVDDSEFISDEEGQYNIYLTYKGEKYSIPVTVEALYPPVEDYIYISKEPLKTVYSIGEELDLTSATFSGYGYDFGFCGDFINCDILEFEEKEVIKIDYSEFDNTTAGTYTIHVNYGHVFSSFDVTVEDIPALSKGDTNGDGDFTIADMVTVQKFIMGKKTAILSDWKSADLYEDGKIDVYDFIVMRENFIKYLK